MTTNTLFTKIAGLCLASFLLTGCGVGGYHLLHLVFPPDDLYTPVATNYIPLHSSGTITKFTFTPKYKDFYEVGLFAIDGPIPASYEMSGKVVVELIQANEIITSQVVTNYETAGFAGKDMTAFKDIELYSFPVPLRGRALEEITVKVSVLEADREFEKIKDNVGAWIRVSPTP